MLGEVVTTAHELLSPIQATHGMNNRYPYVDQRYIEYEKKKVFSVRSVTLKQKDKLKIKQMDHNTMNFDMKFYKCNEVVKDCNVKPTMPNFVFQI